MHFGEYEISLSLIGLSPLSTSHPNTFQRILVRSSTLVQQSFNLDMDRSLSFASNNNNFNALLRLAFATGTDFKALSLANIVNSQAHYAKGTQSQLMDKRLSAAPTDCKRTVSGSFSLPLQGYFSPFPHGTCSLSVSQEYLALPDGPG